MTGPLDGIRVLDLTSVLFGPFATMTLGDYGAEVIKIEGPEGDTTRHTGSARRPGMAAHYLSSNRNKRSLVLDLKQAEAKEALWRLIDTADVFVHSIRPDAIARLGFGQEEVRARNPRIVYVGLHGFGETGPYGGRPAYDDVIQSTSGLAHLLHKTTGAPAFVPMVVADKTCSLTAVNAIVTALFARERTGRGQYVEVPMFEAMAAFVLLEHAAAWVYDPPSEEPGYTRLLAPWRRPYATTDGWLCVLPYNNKQWGRFVTAAGRPELADDPRYRTLADRSANVADMYALVGEMVASKSTAEWLGVLEELEVPHAPINRIEDLYDDPHLEAVGFFHRFEHPTEGPIILPGPPVRMSDTPAAIRSLAPRFGEDSRAILAEAGLDEAEIEAMIAKGAAIAAA